MPRKLPRRRETHLGPHLVLSVVNLRPSAHPANVHYALVVRIRNLGSGTGEARGDLVVAPVEDGRSERVFGPNRSRRRRI